MSNWSYFDTQKKNLGTWREAEFFQYFLECVKITSFEYKLDRPQLQQWLFMFYFMTKYGIWAFA